LKIIAGSGGPQQAMVERSLLRSASSHALSLCAATLVHVAVALALPRAARPATSPSRNPLQLIEIAPSPPPTTPALEPPVLAAPARPRPTTRRARVVEVEPSSAPPLRSSPARVPQSTPPEPLPPELASEGRPSDFTLAPAPSEPSASDRQGRLPAHSSQPGSGPSPVRATPRPPAGFDRSRGLALAGGLDWRCAFPPEADDADVERGTAVLRIAADAHGRVRDVRVLQDSGHGFGRAARNCAFSKTFVPARGAGGQPVAGVLIVNVRFVR
jgi:periplasmic protein TonB